MTTAPAPETKVTHEDGPQPPPAKAGELPKLAPWLLDFIERAGWSAGQVFFATLLAGGTAATVANLPWRYASVMALSAALASVILTSIQYLSKMTKLGFWPDIIVRLGKTFLASLAGSVAAAHPFNVTTFHWSTALNVAAVAVLTAFGKGLLARTSDTGAAMAGAGIAVNALRNPSTLTTRNYVLATVRGTSADDVALRESALQMAS